MDDGWVAHDGGPMPVSADTLVLTKRGRGQRDSTPSTAGWWNDDGNPENSNWSCADERVRIIAYRVVPA